jgi:hypothetical protein
MTAIRPIRYATGGSRVPTDDDNVVLHVGIHW